MYYYLIQNVLSGGSTPALALQSLVLSRDMEIIAYFLVSVNII